MRIRGFAAGAGRGLGHAVTGLVCGGGGWFLLGHCLAVAGHADTPCHPQRVYRRGIRPGVFGHGCRVVPGASWLWFAAGRGFDPGSLVRRRHRVLDCGWPGGVCGFYRKPCGQILIGLKLFMATWKALKENPKNLSSFWGFFLPWLHLAAGLSTLNPERRIGPP